MAEPIAPTISSGGLVLLGVATGLHPMFLVTGFVGYWWYSTITEGTPPIMQRLVLGILAALIAAWTTPPLLAWLAGSSWWPAWVQTGPVGMVISLAIGFLAHKVIGPSLLKIAAKKIEDTA